jgi:hypothetical protein
MRIQIHKVIESGSNPDPDADPDPQPWAKASYIYSARLIRLSSEKSTVHNGRNVLS